MSRVQVGFVAPFDRSQVAAMEALPIDSLWVGGHVASPNPTPEAMVWLARLVEQTTRVQVGTAVLLLPLYPPAIVAKQVADLDRASGGRLVLGVGVGGEYPAEFRACGVPLAERGLRTDAAIGLLRRYWTAEEVDGVRIHPAPAQPGGPPIVVAGRKPPAMRRAARLGDGWMPYLYSPERYRSSVARVREAAEASGRDLDAEGFAWMLYAFVSVDDDGSSARRRAAAFLGGTYRQDFEAMVDRVAVAGTPAEVAERLAAFVDAGVRSFVFSPAASPDPVAAARLLAEELVPSLPAG